MSTVQCPLPFILGYRGYYQWQSKTLDFCWYNVKRGISITFLFIHRSNLTLAFPSWFLCMLSSCGILFKVTIWGNSLHSDSPKLTNIYKIHFYFKQRANLLQRISRICIFHRKTTGICCFSIFCCLCNAVEDWTRPCYLHHLSSGIFNILRFN